MELRGEVERMHHQLDLQANDLLHKANQLKELDERRELDMAAAREGWQQSERIWKDELETQHVRIAALEAQLEEGTLVIATEKLKLDAAVESYTKKLDERPERSEVEALQARVSILEAERESGVDASWRSAYEEAQATCDSYAARLEAKSLEFEVERRQHEFDVAELKRLKATLESRTMPADAAAALHLQLELLAKEQEELRSFQSERRQE